MGQNTRYGYKLDQTGQQTQDLLDVINNKVDKVEGKGLSANDFTDADKAKLDGIQAGAEANVQADWSQNTPSADDYVRNRTHWEDNGEVHKLDNKYIDMDLAPTAQSDKPVMSGGVASAISNFITRSVNDLMNYYLKSETYTKEEVESLIGAAQNFHYEIYPSLEAVTHLAGNVLYLIGPTGSGTDRYEEYVYDQSRVNPWVKIGDTSVDLSEYVTTTILNAALAHYTPTVTLNTLLAAKVGSETINNIVELTQAEYDALTNKRDDTMYITTNTTKVYIGSRLIKENVKVNEEDIDFDSSDKLQFADRVNGVNTNGKNYVILRRNKTFAEQVTETDTIYEIRDVFDLNNTTITIPSGCILKFDGGKISGGTMNFGDALIDADDVVVFDDVTFSNCTSNQKVKTIWFGITQNGQSNSAILENILDSFAYVFVNPGSYTMERQITIANTARIKEFTANKAQMAIDAVTLTFPNSNGFVIKKRIYMCGVSISGKRGTYNAQDKVFENGFVGIDLYVSCVIEYCTISTWATGIETYNGEIISGVIRKCVFQQCGNYGLRFYSDSTIGSNNANLITDNYFVNCGYDGLTAGTESTGKTSGIGMYVKGGSGNTIFHNVFEYCSGIGLFIDQPTTTSIYRGLVVIGNYFEYCKWSNMYVDLNTSNSSIVHSIIIKGNSYSDSNRQLPADAQRNRSCNILDLYGMMFVRYIQTDFADRTLYQKYGAPLLFDMSMLTFYNTGWDKIDWDNDCIRFIQGSSSEAFTFVRGRAKRGYYALMVNCRNAGTSNKVLSIQYKIDGQSTITKPISLTTSMNTFARRTADRIFSNKEFEIQLQGAYSSSLQAGDRVEFNEIVLQEITSVTTAVRETLTPYAGFSIFDSTLNKMVLYNGTAWVNMDGTPLA